MQQNEEAAAPAARPAPLLHRARAFLRRAEHRLIMRVTLLGHLAYYGLVSFEAHGNYRYAAGIVGVLLIVEAFTGGEAE